MSAFFLLGLGTPEMIVIAIVGLLLFGRRLPEVGRSLGKSFIEFKSGLQDVQAQIREVDQLSDEIARSEPRPAPVRESGENREEVIVDPAPESADESATPSDSPKNSA